VKISVKFVVFAKITKCPNITLKKQNKHLKNKQLKKDKKKQLSEYKVILSYKNQTLLNVINPIIEDITANKNLLYQLVRFKAM